jgi:2-polyprenyl-3-methyl-5-hydroxy-6-metoxy-1,4-benzoquinol methylase
MILKLAGLSSSYSMGKSYDLVECLECKTWFTKPEPDSGELSRHYASNYAFNVHLLVNREKLTRARGLIRATKIFEAHTKVLEIGTGGGELASEMAKQTKLVHGCELDSASTQRANLYPGVDIECLDVEEYCKGLNQEYYDVAVFSHTLEHFLNPLSVLEKIKPSLTKSAKICIVMPNRNASPRIFKKKWGYWQVPIHVTHHSLESVTNLCKEAELVVDQVVYRRSDFMALGSFLINIRNKVDFSDISNSLILSRVIPILSNLYALTYRFGRQDMIVIASQKQFHI